MKWFGRRRDAVTDEGVPAEVREVHVPAELKEALDVVWRLTRLPKTEFELTYGELLARTWRYLGNAAGEPWTGLKSEIVGHLVAALRVRQARIVPRTEPMEDAARLGEVMTFALAAAVVADRVGQAVGRSCRRGWCPWAEGVPPDVAVEAVPVPGAYGALVAAELVGAKARAWLGQEPVAMRAVASYFGEGQSELRAIADEAATRIGLPVGARARVEEEAGEPEGAVASDVGSAAPVVGSVEGPVAGDGAMDAPSGAGAEPGPDVASFRRQEEAPEDLGTGAGGWEWVNWIRRGVWDASLPVNVADGWLFNVDGQAFVAVPDGFDAFVASGEGAIEAGVVRNRVARLRKQRTHRARNGSDGADMWRVRMPDGSVRVGMLFEGALLWDRSPPPASGATLRRGRGR